MPKRLNHQEMDLWNFYIDKPLKTKFSEKVDSLGLERQQSACIRAMIELFTEDSIDLVMLFPKIVGQIYITPKDKMSKL